MVRSFDRALREQRISSHALKTASLYFLEVLFKISNEHPCLFYIGGPHPTGAGVAFTVTVDSFMVGTDIFFQNSRLDFSLIKIKFPRPNKYKMSDVVSAPGLSVQLSFPLVH